MKLSNFEKFVIQFFKDTWRILLILAVFSALGLWALFTLIEKLVMK